MFRLQIYDNQCLNCKTTQERIYTFMQFSTLKIFYQDTKEIDICEIS